MDAFHLVTIEDLSDADLAELFAVAKDLKARWAAGEQVSSLHRKSLGMIFEKPSLRTRVSFEIGMNQLGGRSLYISPEEIGLGKREAVQDVARVLSGYVDGIMARTFHHKTIVTLAEHSRVPVINGLSDYSHPCQALADVLTAMEEFGDVRGRTLAFIGDGNNVARSLVVLCGRLGMAFRLAAPEGYELDEKFLAVARKTVPGLKYELTRDPLDAARGADVVYTDTWVSMGQESEKATRMKVFANYQVSAKLMAVAAKDAIVMHCLPAYRGLEITDDVIDGPQSRVFQEAENRMHAQKAVLHLLLQKPRKS
jgi:ornithine carbamoyltransferase